MDLLPVLWETVLVGIALVIKSSWNLIPVIILVSLLEAVFIATKPSWIRQVTRSSSSHGLIYGTCVLPVIFQLSSYPTFVSHSIVIAALSLTSLFVYHPYFGPRILLGALLVHTIYPCAGALFAICITFCATLLYFFPKNFSLGEALLITNIICAIIDSIRIGSSSDTVSILASLYIGILVTSAFVTPILARIRALSFISIPTTLVLDTSAFLFPSFPPSTYWRLLDSTSNTFSKSLTNKEPSSTFTSIATEEMSTQVDPFIPVSIYPTNLDSTTTSMSIPATSHSSEHNSSGSTNTNTNTTNANTNPSSSSLDYHIKKLALEARMGWTVAFYAAFLFMIFGLLTPIVQARTGLNPWLWAMHFIFSNNINIWLTIYWLFLMGVSIYIFPTEGNLNLRRKFFHLLATAAILPGYLFAPVYTCLAMDVTFAFFIVLELLRVGRVPPFGDYLHQKLSVFCDQRDEGIILTSHIYLLLGLASPVWVAALEQKWEIGLSGMATLGIGDTFASIVGSSIGRHRWFQSSPKTIEGTLAFFISSLLFYIVLGEVLSLKLVLSILLAALVEAVSTQFDNLFIPVIMLFCTL